MSSEADKRVDDWKRLLYAEAWKQYCHEDNLGQNRNNLFLAVQAALIALLTFVAKPLLELETTQFWNHNVHLGTTALGLLAVLIGVFSLTLDRYWKAVIEAGRAYINIRWCTVIAIEMDLAIQQYGPATLETTWRSFSKTNPGQAFQPFPRSDSLKSIMVPPLPEIRGWLSMQKVVSVLQTVHWGVFVAGLILVALGVLGIGP